MVFKVIIMKDFFNKEFEVGNYVCYPRVEGESRIEYVVGKIISINATSLTVMYRYAPWRNVLSKTVLKRPDRAIIISEEFAFEKEPMLKDMSE